MNTKTPVKRKSTQSSNGSGGAILHLTVSDKAALYTVYMPFVKGGAIFVPTPRPFQLGDEVFVLLTLWDSAEPLPILGNVVWTTPVDAQAKRAAGIGVQFKPEESDLLRARIETLLAGIIKSDKPTHTM